MSARLNLDLFRHLVKVKLTKKFIESLPTEFLTPIFEIALNVSIGNVNLLKAEEQQFARRQSVLKLLSRKTVSVSQKKKKLTPALVHSLLIVALRHFDNGAKNAAGL